MSQNNLNTNKYGISSLAGFAFQIKVFSYFVLDIYDNNDSIEFETIDDVNLKITPKNIDNNADKFISKLNSKEENKLIQVKRAKLSQDDYCKTLYNWILETNKTANISEYILFSEHTYNNEDLMFTISAKELLNKAIKTTHKRSDSIEVKIKKLYKNKYSEFEHIYNYIKQRYLFIGNKDINDIIYEKAKFNLRFLESNRALYNERLKYFMLTIQNNILNAINCKKPYILSYQDTIRIYEDINLINQDNYCIPYCSYRDTLEEFNLSDTKIANLRETKQLKACKLSEYNLKERLNKLAYYTHFRNLSSENGKESIPKSIELTTFNNFQTVLEELEDQNEDTPRNRLFRTEHKSNSHAKDEETKQGSCIFLTGENVLNQISWKED